MDYKKIDTDKLDWSASKIAQKTAKVTAEFVEAGSSVSTVMKDGHVETNNIAPEGGAMKVTNPSGEQYLVSPEKFASRYSKTDAGDYAPIAEPVQVMFIDENVSFTAPWGEEMRIKAGGVLVNAGPGDVYGIQPEEFNETYSVLGDYAAEAEDPFAEKAPAAEAGADQSLAQ
jgi:hypothetical protein